ncbi:MAG TPA: hypothetical protein VNL71_11935, partial [Chloroflexota bacterium]|nr:hypothetical protein [Chloroflexota bacterium]
EEDLPPACVGGPIIHGKDPSDKGGNVAAWHGPPIRRRAKWARRPALLQRTHGHERKANPLYLLLPAHAYLMPAC